MIIYIPEGKILLIKESLILLLKDTAAAAADALILKLARKINIRFYILCYYIYWIDSKTIMLK